MNWHTPKINEELPIWTYIASTWLRKIDQDRLFSNIPRHVYSWKIERVTPYVIWKHPDITNEDVRYLRVVFHSPQPTEAAVQASRRWRDKILDMWNEDTL